MFKTRNAKFSLKSTSLHYVSLFEVLPSHLLNSLLSLRAQGPEPAVPVVAVAVPRGGREEPAGLDVRGRGAGAAGQECSASSS